MSSFNTKWKELWRESTDMEHQFSQLKYVIQNPNSLTRDNLETFLLQIQQFETKYEAWKFKTIEAVENKVYPTLKN
jgi:hypothetical protein